mmetsp:Transcript_23625/g.55043  ORF Transcript_23625/g.55043 Transcript_23625/m.55043 type:complete len:1084 (-) Transcript_23625:164-3415(-)|eukprot:CAMPEP_0178406600 /NCGR_PEP_ID=MMETSP0689_2-20121128/18995_1 /TAXON_ID=160604 /ORGANISM="Amphidinium massartii, Strain CS-259" /LENGTH=1083 /DNA_ID=CAMNT_0020027645 /DNA_START=40 /DNA_END=3288 /DNA_ORIENTATION=+
MKKEWLEVPGAAGLPYVPEVEVEDTRLEKPKRAQTGNSERESEAESEESDNDQAFNVHHHDLIDNVCAQVLQNTGGGLTRGLTYQVSEAIRELHQTHGQGPSKYAKKRGSASADAQAMDWSKAHNIQQLGDLCSFLVQLFWAFEVESFAVQAQDRKKASGESLKEVPQTGIRGAYARFVAALTRATKSEIFSVYLLVILMYALFVPDIFRWRGNDSAENLPLAIANTTVFALLILDAVINCFTWKGYFRAGYFWVDVLATVSMVPDTWFANDYINTNAAAAGKGSRLVSLAKIGGKSGRLLRLKRATRAARVVWLLPRMQRLMREWGLSNLAYLLVHKRLWHVFQYLDTRNTGTLNDNSMEMLQTSMCMVFAQRTNTEGGKTADGDQVEDDDPAEAEEAEEDERQPEEVKPTTPSKTLMVKKTQSRMLPSSASKMWQAKQTLARASSAMNFANGYVMNFFSKQNLTFPQVMRELLSSAEGKLACRRCARELHCLQESCALLDMAIGQMVIKVSLIVLLCIVLFSLLEPESGDTTAVSNLAMLHDLTSDLDTNPREVTSSVICRLIGTYASPAPPVTSLLFLVLHGRVFHDWRTDLGSDICAMDAPARYTTDADPKDTIDDIFKNAPVEPFEVLSICYPDEKCDKSSQIVSYAVFDVHEELREQALAQILLTGTTSIVIVALAALFANDLKRLSNNNLLHPLWELLDDMCTMKCMEVIQERINPNGQAPTAKNVLVALGGARRKIMMMLREPMDSGKAMDEVLQLRGAFEKMRGAMLAWGKYVPATLLKQLLMAGTEAEIGCSRMTVSILFVEFTNLDKICKKAPPEESLAVLGGVLEQVYEVLEEHCGTLLEFIGAEVLAVFGAPVPVTDSSAQAIHAALAMVNRCKYLTADTILTNLGDKRQARAALMEPVRLECGVHTATVLAGNIGSPSRMKYGVLGDGVNLSARLKTLNSRYGTQVLVSSTCLDETREAKEKLVYRTLGNLILKGRTVPTKTYEVMAKTGDMLWMEEPAQQHEEAFRLYSERRFDEASALFSKVQSALSEHTRKEDRPSSHLQKLCEQLSANPPPDDWDATEKLTKKVW